MPAASACWHLTPSNRQYPSTQTQPDNQTHHEALQVELRGDAQGQLALRGVVKRGEGAGVCAPGDRFQHGRLHLRPANVVGF